MSIVNHKFQHGFIHVPKCAGTSMERMPFVGGNSHISARLLKHIAPRYFWWGFVRHPADRCMSAFGHLNQFSKDQWQIVDEHGCEISVAGLKLEDFVQLLRYSYKLNMLTTPMIHYLCDERHNIIVDFVGRYESLDKDWHCILKMLKIPYQPLPVQNKSRHEPWYEILTPGLLNTIESIYQDDYRVFEYLTSKEQNINLLRSSTGQSKVNIAWRIYNDYG